MFKKIYIEITNICNLNCSFCAKNSRQKEFLSLENFNILIDKIKNYTNYLYFHIMGEPTLHPNINEFIDVASKNFNINITTNGTFIDKISDNKNIRQINISLHSINDNLKEHLHFIFENSEKLLNNNTIVNYRLWVKNNYYDEIVKIINEYYKVDVLNLKNKKIKTNLYIDFPNEFIWPSLNNKENYEGTCKGTIDHIGILVDGTVVPCCLDNNGIINLGNIYHENIDKILQSDKFKQINEGFKQNKRIHPLCKTCNFYQKKDCKK